jgi:ribonuclease J
MRVRIHRGAHEIGGSCLEVEADGSRIVLDVGRPLSAGGATMLPPVAGFSEDDPSLVGVVISHAHQDHWGLADHLPAAVPIYMGEATHRILTEAAFWSKGLTVEPAGFLRHRQPIRLGPSTVTPSLNDHSAFDAYSLLVEAEACSTPVTSAAMGASTASSPSCCDSLRAMWTCCCWKAPMSNPTRPPPTTRP